MIDVDVLPGHTDDIVLRDRADSFGVLVVVVVWQTLLPQRRDGAVDAAD
jgi:hypothetical protein